MKDVIFMLEVQGIEAERRPTTCAPLHLYKRLLTAMLYVVVQKGTFLCNGAKAEVQEYSDLY